MTWAAHLALVLVSLVILAGPSTMTARPGHWLGAREEIVLRAYASQDGDLDQARITWLSLSGAPLTRHLIHERFTATGQPGHWALGRTPDGPAVLEDTRGRYFLLMAWDAVTRTGYAVSAQGAVVILPRPAIRAVYKW